MKTPKEIAKFICKMHNSNFDNLDYYDKLKTLRHAQASIMICGNLIANYIDVKVNANEFLYNVEKAILDMVDQEMNFYKYLEQREEPADVEEVEYTEEQKLEMLYQQEQQQKYYFEQ